MKQIVHETRAMRRFFFSYTLHLTSVIFIPFMVAIFLLAIGFNYTNRFFAEALILDLYEEDPVVEYVLSFVFAFATLIFTVYLLSIVMGAYQYAKNMFLPFKQEFFGEQEITPEKGHDPSIQHASYPPKPTSPPKSNNVPSTLATAYAESSDRARWGPR